LKTGSEIPKIIWFAWLQGLDNAPDLVHRCFKSWKNKNPDWEINFIDNDNLNLYIDIIEIVDVNRKDISIQGVSNLIRINLLEKYGGVWVDATCYCCQPLNEWLNDYTESGFFVFRDPGVDRILSNWFMVSAESNHLTKRVCHDINHFWEKYYFSNQYNIIGKIILKLGIKCLNNNSFTTKYWLSILFTKLFRVYPYFIFHYHFADIIRKDNISNLIWQSIPYFYAALPHKIQSLRMYSLINDDVKKTIDELDSPVQKLSWKTKNILKSIEGTVLEYFYNQN